MSKKEFRKLIFDFLIGNGIEFNKKDSTKRLMSIAIESGFEIPDEIMDSQDNIDELEEISNTLEDNELDEESSIIDQLDELEVVDSDEVTEIDDEITKVKKIEPAQRDIRVQSPSKNNPSPSPEPKSDNSIWYILAGLVIAIIAKILIDKNKKHGKEI